MSLNVLYGILYTYNGFSENLFPLILTFRCSSETLPLLHRNFLLCNFYDMNYSSAKWKRKREKILRMDGYIDQISRRYGRIQEATTVHHIYPVKDYPGYSFDGSLTEPSECQVLADGSLVIRSYYIQAPFSVLTKPIDKAVGSALPVAAVIGSVLSGGLYLLKLYKQISAKA